MVSAVWLLWCLAAVWAELERPSNEINTENSEETFPWRNQRLPIVVQPDQYFICIHPDLTANTFTGQVHILVTVLNDTRLIVLNSKGLAIKEVVLRDLTQPAATYRRAQPVEIQKQILLHEANGRQERSVKNQVSLRVLESEANEQLALISDVPLKAGHQFQLSISYSGNFSRSYSGLYKATYMTPDGDLRTIVATNFEPSYAREAFPCFDEPGMKALFSLVVVREAGQISLSNMPELYTKALQDGLEEDHYQASARMSSYLVAFVVCDFAQNTAQTKKGVKVSVFAADHQINQTHHALKVAVDILEFYEEYFKISYPLPKIDLVAIPDFEAGAMENWGLVTFRETSLLYQEHRDSLRGRSWVSLVTAHELAHQWFGNLVTMQWWDDVWLNEGFASYLEYVAIKHLEPHWGMEDQYLLMNMYKALERDSLLTTHSVSLPVSGSTQIREMFDAVSYSKGASVLGMLHMYLSDHVFLSGIQSYLRTHLYNNAQPDDLWTAMSETAQQNHMFTDVKALMDTWITQRGYPVVSVSIQGTHIHLRQDLFTILPQNDTDSLWQIPFTFYTSSSSTVTIHLMTSKEEIIDLPEEVTWIKANVNSSGFYRVFYDSHTLLGLVTQLEGGQARFSSADRAGLIDDTFHLARQGSLHYCEAFKYTLFMKTEHELLPITVFINHMTNMIHKFSFNKQPCIAHLLKEHLWSMLGRLADAQRWEDAGSLPFQSRRVKLLELAARLGRSPETEQNALRLFHFWMAKNGDHPLPATLRGLIFQVGVRKGGHIEWKFLLKKYQQNTSCKEKAIMLAALCHTTSQSKIQWLLNASLQHHVIKTQDFSLIVEQLAFRPTTNEMVWKFLQKHWEQILLKYPLGSPYLSGIVKSTTSHFNSTEKYDEVYDFFVTKKKLSYMSFVKQSLETIKVNMHWIKTNTVTIQSWLQKTYPNSFKSYLFCKKEVAYRFKWGTTIHIRI
ncbi:endoplasmic reticulum aminopeptidase 1-like [Hypomesus transpacificus]|uniref:endoplasmic reticulum aminopeptidase 1-like n=1 Tax=Hypomesus transpacificus TaxID=137520 RepID=UPI001F07E2B3|nr:endoplasmic reticulum aminopeptidase 1-like [Hypomesus transpacificus]